MPSTLPVARNEKEGDFLSELEQGALDYAAGEEVTLGEKQLISL